MKKTLQIITLCLLAVTSSSVFAQKVSVIKDARQTNQIIYQPVNDLKIASCVIQTDVDITVIHVLPAFQALAPFFDAVSNTKLMFNNVQQGSTLLDSKDFFGFADLNFVILANTSQNVAILCHILPKDSIVEGSEMLTHITITYKENTTGVEYTKSVYLQKAYWRKMPVSSDVKNVDITTIGIVAYPNPANSIVEFSNTPTDANVTITDLTGRAVYTGQGNRVDASLFQNGVYVAQIATGNTVSYVRFTKF